MDLNLHTGTSWLKKFQSVDVSTTSAHLVALFCSQRTQIQVVIEMVKKWNGVVLDKTVTVFYDLNAYSSIGGFWK